MLHSMRLIMIFLGFLFSMSCGKEIKPRVMESEPISELRQVPKGVREEYKSLDALASFADLASSISGFPISEVFDVVIKITDFGLGGEPSLWDQIEGKVKSEIRTAFTDYVRNELSALLKLYKRKLQYFGRRGENLEAHSETTDQDRKGYIDDMYDHLANTDFNSHKFDFEKFKGTLKFEWALFDLYIANVTHQLLILMMLIRECEKLPKQQVDIKFKTQTYTKRLKRRRTIWAEYATITGPEVAKELFWSGHSFHCDKSGQSLTCKDFEGRSMTLSYRSSYKFASGDILPNGDVAKCSCKKLWFSDDGTCHRMVKRMEYDYYEGLDKRGFSYNEEKCGFSYRRFYLPIAQKIYNKFTAPILNLVTGKRRYGPKMAKKTGVSGNECLNGAVCANKDGYVRGPWCKTEGNNREECYNTDINSLPKYLFAKDCVTPCGKWGKYHYSWCLARTATMPYGGTWKKC